MRPAAHHLTTPAFAFVLEADALFVSALQCSDELSASQIRQAIAAAVGTFGCLGCAGRVAQEFGDHPETAVTRMRWARAAADQRRASGRAGGRLNASARLGGDVPPMRPWPVDPQVGAGLVDLGAGKNGAWLGVAMPVAIQGAAARSRPGGKLPAGASLLHRGTHPVREDQHCRDRGEHGCPGTQAAPGMIGVAQAMRIEDVGGEQYEAEREGQEAARRGGRLG
jgi:hypothetical protein